MKVFLSLCLLFSLVSPGVLQTCRRCESFTRTECTANDSQKCGFKSSSCKSAVVHGDLLRFITRAHYSCGVCKAANYAFTTGSSGSFNMVVHCCKRDQCNKKPLEIPSEPMEPNGLECTGCYAENQDECKGVEVVSCTGNQTKCMKLNVFTPEFGSYSARGCATPDMCRENELNNMNSPSSFLSFSVKCHDAV